MGKVGCYGASLDPITNVHLWTASTVAHRCRLDKVVIFPGSNLRDDKNMKISDEHRWNMLNLAIAGNPKFIADDYEMKQKASEIYSYFTMEHFKKMYPDDELYFIMGADLLVDIAKGDWKYGEEFIANNKFIVMARNGIDMLTTISRSAMLRNYDDGTKFHLVDKGLAMEISSSYIREELARNGEPRYLLPEPCYDYIKKNGLYQ